jgi:4-amino-4-deoxy-L-arabinose transferase-like glycosyltransferase
MDGILGGLIGTAIGAVIVAGGTKVLFGRVDPIAVAAAVVCGLLPILFS